VGRVPAWPGTLPFCCGSRAPHRTAAVLFRRSDALLPSRPGTESQVEASLDNIDVGVDVDRKYGGRTPDHCAAEVARTVAEAVVVVFDETGEPIQKGIFTADANCPTVARLAECGERIACKLEIKIAFQPSAAALHIGQEPIPGVSSSKGNRGQRLDLESSVRNGNTELALLLVALAQSQSPATPRTQ